MATNKYIQVIGFIIVIGLFWRLVGPELAVVSATVVAIWEFLKPSRFN
jgi:hypothetical protein